MNSHDQTLESNNWADHAYLEEWFSEYQAVDSNMSYNVLPNVLPTALKVVMSDDIDDPYVAEQIASATTTMNVEYGICSHCRHLFDNWPNTGSGSWSHAVGGERSTAELEAGSRSGCRFCSLFMTQLLSKIALDHSENALDLSKNALDLFRRIERRIARLGRDETASISIGNWASDQSQLLWLNLPGKVTSDKNSTIARLTEFESHVVPASHLIAPSMNYFNIAKFWLQTCVDGQHTCIKESQSDQPTRLVYIGNNTVKLVHTANRTSSLPYATLSYCWGTNDFLKLSTTNIDAFCESIPWEQLPRIFREAVEFARELDLLYIWIDALCIVQDLDDNSDWLRESRLMRSIYGGSYVNIAASTAKSVNDSLFCKPHAYCNGVVARVRWSDHDRVQNFHSSDVYLKSVSYAHIASRAWTLQERLLAPRTISLGDTGMFWECQYKIASEFLPHGFRHKLFGQLSRTPYESWNWSHIVEAYSGAALTYPSDKLPALSGIARRQQETTNDEYLAGMWKTRLVQQLGWMHSSEPRPRPAWRSPTWSWASVDGCSYYWSYWNHDNLRTTKYVEVLEASTSPAGPDPFGAVVSASLRIACTALLRGACHAERESNGAYITVENFAHIFAVVMDTDEWKLLRHDEAIYLLPLYGGESGRYKSKRNVSSQGSGQSDGSSERELEAELMIRGLLLQRLSDTKARFKRIGAFDCHTIDPTFIAEVDKSCEVPSYLPFMQAMGVNGAAIAEAVCDEVRANIEPERPKFVIDID